jgi:hypothetical protein
MNEDNEDNLDSAAESHAKGQRKKIIKKEPASQQPISSP